MKRETTLFFIFLISASSADAADANAIDANAIDADTISIELIFDDFVISEACCVISLTKLQNRAKQYWLVW